VRELTAEDRQAISEILSLHGHIFDGGHLDRLGEIFTPEVVYDLTDAGVGTFEGIEAIRSGALKLGARNPVAHHVTNVVITSEEGDLAMIEQLLEKMRANSVDFTLFFRKLDQFANTTLDFNRQMQLSPANAGFHRRR